MPVFNEEKCIEQVIHEWIVTLEKLNIEYKFCIVNDGSIDNTLSIISNLKNTNARIHTINKPNTGHGQSCIVGYKYAIENGANWIFQIDSDGQCDTNYFELFYSNNDQKSTSIFGNRTTRDDGIKRQIISIC